MNHEEVIIEKMVEYFGSDVKRINHALKVWSFSRVIAQKENLDNQAKKTLLIAAILHDIGIKESERLYGRSDGKYQEKEGPRIAEQMLKDFHIEADVLKRVFYLIGHHHTYSAIEGLDYQILVEADFLVNIGEESMRKEKIILIREKLFKTLTGTTLLNKMYVNH